MSTVARASEEERAFDGDAEFPGLLGVEDAATGFRGEPEPREEIEARGVFHFGIGNFGRETCLVPVTDIDAPPFRCGCARCDGDEVNADGRLEVDEEHVELAFRERAGVEDAITVVVDERDAFQRRRHRG